MAKELNIALAQINPTVGDVLGNINLIRVARKQCALETDILVAGELVVSGYPPEDLVLKQAFIDKIESQINTLALETNDGGPAILLGTPWQEDGNLYNAALLLSDGIISTKRFKHLLPSYGVFDEARVFSQGPIPGPISFKGMRIGVMICEDMWEQDVAEGLQEAGAEILLVLNGSPFEVDKPDNRMNFAINRVRECKLPLAYVNIVGGQDELVFDGGSFVINQELVLMAQAKRWESQTILTTWAKNKNGWICNQGEINKEGDNHPEQLDQIYRAMVLGLRDYVNKNKFPGLILGLSGGIDSAVSAVVAVDAIGADRVHCVMMPSPFTSKESIEDAIEVVTILGAAYDTIPINKIMVSFEQALSNPFKNLPPDTTEENIQARSRGIIIMALSNKLGFLPLTTGNKSEMSVGYATLYGDMCGGFSVLKDLYKTTVFDIARWRNANFPENVLGPKGLTIPKRIITKKPSAELQPNQFDDDTLPPYHTLDQILKSLIEEERGVPEIVKQGHDQSLVRHIWSMIDNAEYKRRQAPPGVKISSRAFGKDRRYPITNGFTKII